jgi:hypothetical protein
MYLLYLFLDCKRSSNYSLKKRWNFKKFSFSSNSKTWKSRRKKKTIKISSGSSKGNLLLLPLRVILIGSSNKTCEIHSQGNEKSDSGSEGPSKLKQRKSVFGDQFNKIEINEFLAQKNRSKEK